MADDLNDREHEIMLDNPVADKEIADRAVARAMARGKTREEAEYLYGYRPTAIYYVKEDNILYRASDGAVSELPDQALRKEGWGAICGSLVVSRENIPGGSKKSYGNQPDPLIMTMVSRITKAEAMEIAEGLGLPTENWDAPISGDVAKVELNDEEHELMLDNPEADAWIAEQAVKKCMARGKSREFCEEMYRPKPVEKALDTGVMNRITREVIAGAPPATPDTPKMAELRKELEVEIAQAKEKGLMIDMVPD